jgi:metallo-beta-lactamase class B
MPELSPRQARLGVYPTRFQEKDLCMRLLIAAIVVSSLIAQSAYAQPPSAGQANTANDFSCANDPSWTAPQKPFRIYGNTWYVGPRGLTVLLITTPTGDALIDGGVPGYAPLIEANIRNLGINLRDIKWILNSHAHCDHAGGIAQLARDTGAQVIASAADTPLLERGGHDDPEYGDRFLFPSVHVTRTVTDGESLRLGDLVLTAHSTQGHTKGNTTWTWTSCEDKRCLHMVDVGSLSAPDYKLIGNPKYPGIVKDYEHSFVLVAALPCDIPLAPHPEMVDFWERVAKRKQGDADALIDPAGCRTYAKDARESFEAKLAKQRADAASAK